MPKLYIDLDNNRLVTGPQSTQLAATPRFWAGDKPVLDVELLTRTNGVIGHYTSAASSLNVRVGTLGGAAAASALTLSVVTLSAQATATAGITAAVTATGAASLLGSITATATCGVNSPSVVTITPTVTTFASAQAVAYLGPQAISPVLKISRDTSHNRYLDVVEAGTPYDSSTTVYATATSADVYSYLEPAVIHVPYDWVSSPSITHAFIYKGSLTISGTTITGSSGYQTQFLNNAGVWINSSSVTNLASINIKDIYSVNLDNSPEYLVSAKLGDPTVGVISNTFGAVTGYGYNILKNPMEGTSYGFVALKSNQVSSSLTTSFPYTFLGISVATLGINLGNPLIYTQSLGYRCHNGETTPGLSVTTFANYDLIQEYYLQIGNFRDPSQEYWNGLMEVRSCASISRADIATSRVSSVTVTSKGFYAGEEITLSFDVMPDGRKIISGGQVQVQNYKHQPALGGLKNYNVFVDPVSAYIGRRVESIEIVSCGAQYATTPSVYISEPEDENGIPAKATAVVVNHKIKNITITDPGSGYSKNPDVFIMPPVSQMKYGSSRTVTSVILSDSRRLVLGLASGVTIQDNSWAILDDLYNANGLAYVVTAAANQVTLKFPYNLASVISTGNATITPLVPYVRVTGATITGTDANYAVGSTIPITFSTPSCGDTDAVAEFSVANSGQIALSAIPTPGFATAFSVATISAYKKITGITVTCAGSGYWSAEPQVTIDNTAYVATAPGATPASVTAVLKGNGQISLSVVCSGYGYTTAPGITVAAPNQGDGIRIVTLVTRGVGYSNGTYACTVATAPSGGTDAVVNFIQSGTSQSFEVINAGRGYVAAPVITVPAPDLGGQVSAFTVTCEGAGYDVTNLPQITISGGGGTGASATAVVADGKLAGLTITSSGFGYTSAPSVSVAAPETSVYYSKQIDLSTASVTTLLAGASSASAYLQIDEKSGSNTSVLAQIPITLVAKIS